MHKYYINSIDDDTKLPITGSNIYMLDGKKATQDSKKCVVYSESFELIEQLPIENNQQNTIVGYIYADKKAKKHIRWNQNNKLLTFNFKTFANIYDKPQMMTIGYLKSDNENEFFEVTRPLLFMPFLFWLIGLICVLLLVFPSIDDNIDVIIYGDDITTQGEIVDEIVKPMETEYFNIIINTTPIIKDNKMNICIENSLRNSLNCHVEIIADISGEEKTIYNSPLIHPNNSIEDATIIEPINKGVYTAKALFTYFDEEENQLDLTTTIQLIINVE